MDSVSTSISSPISPWGKMQEPKQPVSLADIMSEELAKDLQSKEEERFSKTIINSSDPVPLPVFEDEYIPGCSSDHTIAQMLQTQFDKEYDHMLKKTEDKFNGTSKVCISYSNYRVVPENMEQDSDSDTGDDVDDKCNWDRFASSEKTFKTMPKCGYKKQGEDMVTKHDMALAGRRNASKVMQFPPGFHTGDAGSFDMQLSNKVFNSLKVHSKQEQTRKHRVHDKSEQATAEMAVDARTRLLLYKLVNQELLERVNGILSTGKEAVVIHADGGTGSDSVVPKECALKVFKTTLNEFKSRDKYIEDDFRFKDRFSKQNPRKIIHLWAEKEMHNLIRMHKAGVRCPEVVVLRKHILVMSFIGKDHRPADKLKNALLKPADMEDAYSQTTDLMKRMYTEAQLVHADLSEYNILWHDDLCWFIDVSQAVERNHPKALEFLFRDCTNICKFFEKKGVMDVKSPSELFADITAMSVSEDGAAMLGKVQDFERNEELLTNEQPQKVYPFEYCWEQSKNEEP